jgi:hypothetical protein
LASYTRTLDEETMTTRVREDIMIEVLKDFPTTSWRFQADVGRLQELAATTVGVEGTDAGERLTAGRAVRGVESSPPAVTAGRR